MIHIKVEQTNVFQVKWRKSNWFNLMLSSEQRWIPRLLFLILLPLDVGWCAFALLTGEALSLCEMPIFTGCLVAHTPMKDTKKTQLELTGGISGLTCLFDSVAAPSLWAHGCTCSQRAAKPFRKPLAEDFIIPLTSFCITFLLALSFKGKVSQLFSLGVVVAVRSLHILHPCVRTPVITQDLITSLPVLFQIWLLD